ncbi:MAG: DUF3791 domain-containing protein [Prevotella sp.]|nr:DUF3791 domain-containing protein [Prevotella sp.]
MNAVIRAFAKRFGLDLQSAFHYLWNFRGIRFLNDYYDIEHLQSIDDAVDDLSALCMKNGGKLS